MTTVAWDGRAMAADRQNSWCGTPVRERKIYRVRAPNGRVALIGCCGSVVHLRAYMAWLQGGERPEFRHDTFRWTIMMVDDTGMVWLRSSDADLWDSMGRRPWAIGSGGNYALGAMAAGCDSARAVRIATKLDTHTGMGVQVLRFQGAG